jgi:N6-adenosine-specific RNA methylase IME4/DNA modification methylase
MARSCATCTHPLRAELDALLTAGNRYTGLRQLAKRYGLSLNGLSRHQRHHLREAPAARTAATGAVEVLPGSTLVHGLAEDVLPTLEAGSVHSVVTSTPYWKKRRYSDDPHELGQEATPERFIARLVAILRPLQQVLRPDGVLLINIGDGHYNVYGGGSRTMTSGNARHVKAMGRNTPPKPPLLQRKSLIRVPWKLADALEADGWLIRNAMLWHKPNPVPETLSDRTTTDYEVVLHVTLGPRYFWNAAAIAEPARWERWGKQTTPKATANGPERASGAWLEERSLEEVRRTLARPTKNRRSVITLPGSTYKGQHGAVMPEALAELLVAASTPPGGRCLDPFAGASTTGIACLRLGEGRRFLGIEKEAPNVAEATDRLRAEAQRLEAVQTARAQAVQTPPTPPLPTTEGGWQLAVIDPPWHFKTRSPKGQGRSASRHYSTMSAEQIKALPIASILAKDAMVALWSTAPHDAIAHEVLKAWGLTYSTKAVWIKVNQNGIRLKGTGKLLQQGPEYLFVARRGKGLRMACTPPDAVIETPAPEEDLEAEALEFPGVIEGPRREHSRKPDEAYQLLERLFGPDVRRVDLFSREERPGWATWGLERGRFSVLPRTLPLPLEPAAG